MASTSINNANNGSGSSTTGAIRRTIHACAQCRERKQKCGGVTTQATCNGCQNRNVRCSFEDEAKDPRFNPYLRIQSVPPREQSSPRSDPASPPYNPGRGSSHQDDKTINPHQHDKLLKEVQRLQKQINNLQGSAYGQHSSSSRSVTRTPSLANIISTSPPQNGNSVPMPIPAPIPIPTVQHPLDHSSQSRMPLLPSPTASFDGPMKVLQELGADGVFDVEDHDPISRQMITHGEANVAFRIFFTKCHPNAPFLDAVNDANMPLTRSRNIALFLNIVVVGARFWSHSSRKDTWLHPRYQHLVSLLDREMTRLILRPRPADLCLETVQALTIYSHWMPVDTSSGGSSFRSRFSESSNWQCLGLAIRWAILLGLEKTVHLPFYDPSYTPTLQDVRAFRTMMYLTESDCYLALSAHRPPTLVVTYLFNGLSRFLSSQWAQPTDYRLVALLKVVQAAHVMGNRAESLESLEAFNDDVDAVERDFVASSATIDPSFDKMGQHFPFTSLRWYRLTFASTLLPPAGNWRNAGRPLAMSIEWASQILYHLSSSNSMTPLHITAGSIDTPLEPDEDLVQMLSFAMDQYFVVIAYTASFLVLAWQSGAIDNQLQVRGSQQPSGQSDPSSRSSPLFRLVDLASRTLLRAAPLRGHLASRYTEFLRGMANIVASGSTFNPSADVGHPHPHGGQAMSLDSSSGLIQGSMDGDMMSNSGGQVSGGPVGVYQTVPGGNGGGGQASGGPEHMWDNDWMNLWHESGLEQGWLFGTMDEGNNFVMSQGL